LRAQRATERGRLPEAQFELCERCLGLWVLGVGGVVRPAHGE